MSKGTNLGGEHFENAYILCMLFKWSGGKNFEALRLQFGDKIEQLTISITFNWSILIVCNKHW